MDAGRAQSASLRTPSVKGHLVRPAEVLRTPRATYAYIRRGRMRRPWPPLGARADDFRILSGTTRTGRATICSDVAAEARICSARHRSRHVSRDVRNRRTRCSQSSPPPIEGGRSLRRRKSPPWPASPAPTSPRSRETRRGVQTSGHDTAEPAAPRCAALARTADWAAAAHGHDERRHPRARSSSW